MSVLSLDDAKAWLNITVDTYDVKLQTTIDSAEAAIGRKVGPLETTTITSRVRGCASALTLPTLPVVSVTTVTGNDSSTVAAADLVADPSGVVSYDAYGSFASTAYTVVYEAGWGTVTDDEWSGPAELLHAVREMVRHLWGSQRGAGKRPGAPDSEELSNTLAASAFVLPNMVQQLIEPYIPLGGL